MGCKGSLVQIQSPRPISPVGRQIPRSALFYVNATGARNERRRDQRAGARGAGLGAVPISPPRRRIPAPCTRSLCGTLSAMLDLAFIRSAVRDKKFWAGLAGAVLLATGLVLWARRSYQHAQARDGLNTFAPFENPAMDLVFPRVVLMNDAARNILEAGVRERLWTLHARGGQPPAMEVRLTDGGQRWFSVVNNQII